MLLFTPALPAAAPGAPVQASAWQERDLIRYGDYALNVLEGLGENPPNQINFVTMCSNHSFFCYKAEGGGAFLAVVTPRGVRCFPGQVQVGYHYSLAGMTTRVVRILPGLGGRFLLVTDGRPAVGYVYSPLEGITHFLLAGQGRSVADLLAGMDGNLPDMKRASILVRASSDPKRSLARCW